MGRPPEYSVRATMRFEMRVSGRNDYCLIHLVPFDHSIE